MTRLGLENAVNTLQSFWADCSSHCTCGKIARGLDHDECQIQKASVQNSSKDEREFLRTNLTITAINTAWLSKVEKATLRLAAESLLLGIPANPVTLGVQRVSVVMAYTVLKPCCSMWGARLVRRICGIQKLEKSCQNLVPSQWAKYDCTDRKDKDDFSKIARKHVPVAKAVQRFIIGKW